ncbi:MAG: glutamate 5-kinase, partial [Arenicella sp.]|nr:glutamate 5-kinase [Arenicella sp.]
MNTRDFIKDKKRWVVKVGSAVLTDQGRGLDVGMIQALSEQLAELRNHGIELILVSSGAVAAGMTQLGMSSRPHRINDLQAAAAVGQASLVRRYEEAFKPFGISIAQVLLTHADIADRERYLNAKSTLSRLLELGVLSVVNENDTVATDEICFGDNDSLAALVCNLVGADLLVVLTDQDGLYTADPRDNSDAELLHEVNADDENLKSMASEGSALGRGGMVTKIAAAQTANRSGALTVVANGQQTDILQRIYQGDTVGTLFATSARLSSKKPSIAFS